MALRRGASRRSPLLPTAPRRATAVVALFSVTLFLSAGLMFLVQPMFAKFILPLFGSTPAVWNASMLFFQTTLLAGYLYAHESTRRLGVRRQAALHVGVLLLPLLVLPLGVPDDWIPPASANPVLALLGLLVVAVGLPFFVVSTTAPLLQRWLSATDHPAAADPYFLYRASNLGSVLGLLGYPLLMEPTLRLADQGRVWSVAYVVLVVLVLGCALFLWRSPPAPRSEETSGDAVTEGSIRAGERDDRPLTMGRRLRWVFLAFVPSSLMLGVTATITTDIAPIPLLWSLPLSLYLISFIIVFAPGSRADRLHGWMVLALPWVVLLLSVLVLVAVRGALWIVVPLHLAGFFVVAMVCHGELARDRPAARSLTEFYLLISLGGALGGVFNAIVAPLVFDGLWEYPLVIVLAALCLPKRAPRIPPGPYVRWLDFGLPLAIGAAAALIVSLLALAGEEAQQSGKLFAFGLGMGVALNFIRRPLRFGLTLGATVLAVALAAGTDEQELFRERSFFGVHRVTASEGGDLHRLVHGTTRHGAQEFSRWLRRTPISYYHHGSPIGQFLLSVPPTITANVAIIGLGTGSIACYSAPGERWTFYEVDPTVERIARDPRLFTYLRDCRGEFSVVLGDARLKLERAPDRRYGLILADAFSSDAVPVHLLTREALELYRSKLVERGIIGFNVTNSYVALEPVLGNLAHEAGLACVGREDRSSREDGVPQTDASDWVLMTGHRRDFGAVASGGQWHDCRRSPGARAWTDDFSNLLGALDLDR
jgi:hypothetical protein